jgi:ADP-ribose pyrophosphatase
VNANKVTTRLGGHSAKNAHQAGPSNHHEATGENSMVGNTSAFVAVDHPGVPVPDVLRAWRVSWPGYRPVDVTPPELRPAGLALSVAEGWAESYVCPEDVPDWVARQAAALVPFGLDGAGWPLNPMGRTGRSGRNLGRWGENQAADPIVIAGAGADRRVLLILRKDVREWAIPGGMVDPGETAPAALVRELREETGVDLTEVEPVILDRTYVADWRATDHAWVTSTVALYRLPQVVAATAGDDAAAVRWWPATDFGQLTRAIEAAGGRLYAAHQPFLASALGRLT